MIDKKAYLRRINYCTDPKVDHQSLFELQKNHQLNIPFENLDIHYGASIILDPMRIQEKILPSKRGGFCYELNGLFYHLLWQIGFDVQMISAQVNDGKGNYGPPFDHMALIVKLDDRWLVDVGFGGFALTPLKLIPDQKQQRPDGTYWIECLDDDRFLLRKHPLGEEIQDKYIFDLKPRAMTDYAGMCIHQQTHPDSIFRKRKLCTLPIPEGRITLTHEKLILTNGYEKTESPVENEANFLSLLKKYFGIVVKNGLSPTMYK